MYCDESDALSNANGSSTTDISIPIDTSQPFNGVKELLYYNTSGTKYLYIFNHQYYKETKYFGNKKPPTRNGTEKDVSRLSSLFKNLDYKTYIYNDFTYDEIMDVIRKVSNEDHRDTSCLCFAVLTHGAQAGELSAADRPYLLQDLTAPLAHGHPSLVGKPKIFFVQACRGNLNDPGQRLELDGGSAGITISSFADFLVFRSSVEDHVSYRTMNGSFMIQELCDVVDKYRMTLDVLQITTLVQRRVCYDRTTYAPNDKSIHNMKQMPETRHTLTKIFMF